MSTFGRGPADTGGEGWSAPRARRRAVTAACSRLRTRLRRRAVRTLLEGWLSLRGTGKERLMIKRIWGRAAATARAVAAHPSRRLAGSVALVVIVASGALASTAKADNADRITAYQLV